MTVRHSARDTVEAVSTMRERQVAAIVVLGGDGTNRIVAHHCGDIPLCTLSTGTNNTFPQMREATVAGLATGLVATKSVGEGCLRREKIFRIVLNGDSSYDCALVDMAVCTQRFIGARALWRADDVSEFFVTFGAPDAVGFSSVAGLLDPIPRSDDHGLYVQLTGTQEAETVLAVPLAPGLVVPIGVAHSRRIEPGEKIPLEPTSGSLALDGEREIELGPEDQVEVRLDADGPLTIDVETVMQEAALQGLLNGIAGGA